MNRESRIGKRETTQRKEGPSTFEDLQVYHVAREFRKVIYGIAKRLPETEKFGLIAQMRRAAVSLTNNIAEGHGRYHYLDQIRFMLQSRGSLEELVDDLNVCEDESYVPVTEIGPLKEDAWRVRQLIDGYIRYLRSRKDSEDPRSSAREAEAIYSPSIGRGRDGADDSRFSL